MVLRCASAVGRRDSVTTQLDMGWRRALPLKRLFACVGIANGGGMRLRRLTIELRETEVMALNRKGFPKEDVRNDRRAVKSAFYGFLDRTLYS